MSSRLRWPDFCKFLAMFLVTWDHASQVVSGQTFNNLIGGGNLVAVHMPLFFIISGYFIDLNKIRSCVIFPFLKDKFIHLIVPALSWTAIYCLITLKTKGPLTFLTFYWYLFSLFVSFIVIMALSKVCNNNKLVILLSTLVVTFLPYSDVANLNFMFPFLWVGYLLRTKLINRPFLMFMSSVIVTACLLPIWGWDYTVYLSRFNSIHISADMVAKYIVRFILGVSFSYILIWLSKRFETSRTVNILSRYGQYTLLTYLASIVLFGALRKYVPISIEQPVLLELLSLLLCIVTYSLCVILQKDLSKNRITRVLLLGNSK